MSAPAMPTASLSVIHGCLVRRERLSWERMRAAVTMSAQERCLVVVLVGTPLEAMHGRRLRSACICTGVLTYFPIHLLACSLVRRGRTTRTTGNGRRDCDGLSKTEQ